MKTYARATLLILFLYGALFLTACTDSINATPTGVVGELQLSLTTVPSPPDAMKETTLRVKVKDAAGVPLEGARVELSTDMIAMRHGPLTGLLTGKGGGIYESTARFSMGGTWRIQLIATRQDGSSRTIGIFDIDVK